MIDFSVHDEEDFYPAYPGEDDPAYLKWSEEQMARGDMAFQPDVLSCHVCGPPFGPNLVSKGVVKLGPVVNPTDPTQTYVLECGHTVM